MNLKYPYIMIFEVPYSFITGLFFSGFVFYQYKDTIIQNTTWLFFKTQAKYQIMFQEPPQKSSFLVTLNDGKLIENNDKSFDLMLYAKLDKDSNIYNYYLYNKSKTSYSETSPINYKFISCEINYKSKTYVVKLNSSDQNFYFEKNIILSKSFVYWYLYKFYNVVCDDNYSINIIDQDISQILLTSKNNTMGICLEMESYSIL